MLSLKLVKSIWAIISIVRLMWWFALSPRKVMPRSFREQPVILNGYGKIKIYSNARIGEWNSPDYFSSTAYIEARNRDSKIIIKSGVRINNGFKCLALSRSVVIDENCLIGSNVTIINSDFHERNHHDRHGKYAPKSEDVYIGKNVWIGSNTTITKGTRIPDNTFVKAHSLVTSRSIHEIQ